MPRDFVGYGENPPKADWPNGARLALNMVINYEEGSERNPLEGDPVREPTSEAAYPVGPTERELGQESIYEYGSRVGIWRIMHTFDQYDVPCTIFCCPVAMERNPEVTQGFVKRGYDMVGHGYRWIDHHGLTEDQEREDIRKCVELTQKLTGQRMIGWFTRPPQTTATRRILQEEGFLFDSFCFNDDLPYWTQVNGKPFLVVPYTLENNDTRFWKTSFFTATDFFHYIRDTFDVLYAESAQTPRMVSLGLHPRIIGRPGRIKALQNFLEHVRSFPDVWICRRTDLAKHWTERHPPKG